MMFFTMENNSSASIILIKYKNLPCSIFGNTVVHLVIDC